MCSRCLLTVAGVTQSACAISFVDIPSATRLSTSRSLVVSEVLHAQDECASGRCLHDEPLAVAFDAKRLAGER